MPELFRNKIMDFKLVDNSIYMKSIAILYKIYSDVLFVGNKYVFNLCLKNIKFWKFIIISLDDVWFDESELDFFVGNSFYLRLYGLCCKLWITFRASNSYNESFRGRFHYPAVCYENLFDVLSACFFECVCDLCQFFVVKTGRNVSLDFFPAVFGENLYCLYCNAFVVFFDGLF